MYGGNLGFVWHSGFISIEVDKTNDFPADFLYAYNKRIYLNL
jgi:hypothetical protein